MAKKFWGTVIVCLLLLGNAGAVYSGLTQTQVSQLYVSIFGRASEGEGNAFWRNQPNMTAAAAAMLGTSRRRKSFGTSLDTNQAFIEHIYANTLNKTVSLDPEGITYWVGLLYEGRTRGEVVALLVGVIEDYAPGTGQYYNPTDAATVAAYWRLCRPGGDLQITWPTRCRIPRMTGRTVTAFNAGLPVTHDPATVQAAKNKVTALAQGGSDPVPATYAWVLVETIHEDGADEMDHKNQRNAGAQTYSRECGPNRRVGKITYVGR
ncbi:MAG: hypothetical protein U5K27_06085 [Desulfotignum sp.]|nr:hypothetical protein [Desulfotignum sp.]